jgi:hypothetical protein
MSTAVEFLDIEKAFDTTWHPNLLYSYKLYKLKFSTSLIKLLSSFLSERKFRVSVKGEMSMHKEIQAGVPQGSVLPPILYSMYKNDIPQTPDVYLPNFADDTCMYATDRKAGYVLRKLQRGLS